MKRGMLILAVVGLFAGVQPLSAQTGGGYDLTWNTFDGGGGTSTGSGYALTGTIGQPDASTVAMTGGGYSLTGGFWYPANPLDVFPPTLASAVSRRTHGGAGDLDLNLLPIGPPSSAGIECRTGGPTQIILTFTEALSPGGSSSMGTLSDGPAADQKTITLAGVANASCPVIALSGITDLASNPLAGDDDVAIRVLAGDANGDAAVNIFDLIAIRNQLNQTVTTGNFRNDITADGAINIFDLIATRNSLNTTVSCP